MSYDDSSAVAGLNTLLSFVRWLHVQFDFDMTLRAARVCGFDH